MTEMQGFLNLNKPAGFTSHDCVAKVRRLLHTKKVGHGGTLDPAAMGVLPIAVGKATRLLPFLPPEKAYQAKICFGLQTDTDDLEGEVIATHSAAYLTLATVEVALEKFRGEISQIPPAYSAIKRQGKKLYELARKGEKVEIEPRIVEINKIQVLAWQPGEKPELEVAIACGPGTYIRAIARDLGNLLQVGGTLANLVRTESCGLQLAQSVTFEELEAENQQLIPPDLALQHLPQVTLSTEKAQRWCQGQRISLELEPGDKVNSQEFYRVYGEQRGFLGIAAIIEHQLKPKVVCSQLSPINH
ncbi:MAG: tRNA pseudouridine(55) synthase TruB [Spirulinaceae cyanobacterium]